MGCSGPPEEPSTIIGPVIDDEALGRIKEYIEIGKQEGRLALAVNVGELAHRGCFIGPHVFTDVAPSARIAQEEIFGPVLAVIKAADLTEALRIANGTEYALTGGLYSRSPATIDGTAAGSSTSVIERQALAPSICEASMYLRSTCLAPR